MLQHCSNYLLDFAGHLSRHCFVNYPDSSKYISKNLKMHRSSIRLIELMFIHSFNTSKKWVI